MKTNSLIRRLMVVAAFHVAACLCHAPISSAQSPAEKLAAGGKRTDRPDPPPGPLLRSAPEFSQWTISYIYPEDRKNAAGAALPASLHPHPTQAHTAKTRDVVHEIVTDNTGKQTETWFSGRTQYIKPPGEVLWRTSSNSDKDAGHDLYHTEELPPSGFRGLDWITPQNYVGTIPYRGGQSALVFVPSGPDKAKVGADTNMKAFFDSQNIFAYIDAETRMPLFVKNNDEMRAFVFGAPPGEMQVLPADLAQQLKAAEDNRTRLGAPALRPY